VRGISLVLVPKYMVNADGSLGERNDAHCVSIEHKLGIHASPTAVLAFGDNGGAVGYLLGEANRGLEYMFVMMNEARMGVGLQGIALGERAFQQALGYARERKQGRDAVSGEALVTIDHHPDIRRMLMTMKSRVEAGRATTYMAAGLLDRAHAGSDPEQKKRDLWLAEFLIPIVKGGGTEMGIEVTSLGIQVYGGMGYIEETGAAQHWRDARITTIYEGTTGIQANDLIGRKLAREAVPGAAMKDLLAEMSATVVELAADNVTAGIAANLKNGIAALSTAADWILANYGPNPQAAAAGAVPFLKLTGIVVGGWLMAKSGAIAAQRIAEGSTDSFFRAKLATATYFADHQLPQAAGLAAAITAGSASIFALPEGLF
jgi:acyl-CoA dehydrogenase